MKRSSSRSWRPRGFRVAVALLTASALLALVHTTDWLDSLGGSVTGGRLLRIQASPHFRDGVFQNPVPTSVMAAGQGLAVARDWLTKQRPRPERPLASVPVGRESFDAPPADGVRVCWLGHSTVLLEIEGERLLFDPVWANRSSPSRLLGPARFQPNPLPLEQLPDLAAVVISHDHYDHLDHAAVRQLARSNPRLPFLVPLGVGAHLEKWGIAPEQIRELDWGEETRLPGSRLKLVAVSSRHFSGRGLLDRNRTLWASWAVLGRARRVFFGGDGGYWEGFAETGRRLGPFDLTMLEIGAAHPNWGAIHLGPEAALAAHRDLQGRWLLPIHWGVFDLAVHAWDEPVETLLASAPAGARLLIPRLGEVVDLDAAAGPEPWWRAAR